MKVTLRPKARESTHELRNPGQRERLVKDQKVYEARMRSVTQTQSKLRPSCFRHGRLVHGSDFQDFYGKVHGVLLG